MKRLSLMTCLIIFQMNAYASLPFHQFKYANKEPLSEYYFGDGVSIENCLNCETVPIPDYLVKGIKELANFKGVDRNITQEWTVGKKAILIDYHHSYLHLMVLTSHADNEISVRIEKTYEISSGHGGVGNNPNTQATPPGIHTIWKKQDGSKDGTRPVWPEDYVIDAYKVDRRARVLTPSQELIRFPSYRGKDGKYKSWQFVTTRILRMRGLEERNNNSEKGRKPNRRAILIHGTNEEGLIGIQASSGCVRMRGHEVIDLFNRVEVNTLVNVTHVVDPWQSKAGKKRVGRPNLPFWNYGKIIDQISVEEADRYWLD